MPQKKIHFNLQLDQREKQFSLFIFFKVLFLNRILKPVYVHVISVY
jgi:hypothetical protein